MNSKKKKKEFILLYYFIFFIIPIDLAEEAIHEAIADYYRKEGKLTEAEIQAKCGLKQVEH